MLNIGIIGCGRIADQHAIEINKLKGCELIAVCDKEILLAEQLAERYSAKHIYTDVFELLKSHRFDIIHITTPPQSHFELAKTCLESGIHLLIEKPIAINAQEAERLISLAESKQLKLTVGHNALFSHAAIRARELIHNGFLGGDPIHIEGIWCYSFANPGYAKAILGDSNHWIRSLPGKYLQDIISHGIGKIVEYLKDDDPIVIAHGSVSPVLKSINENDIVDELRVIIDDKHNTTAYFTFSSQISPPIKQFRIYGPKNSIFFDHEHQTVLKSHRNHKYYLNHFIPPLLDAKQHVGNSIKNVFNFLKMDHYYEFGRKFLIESFYNSIKTGSELPISYRNILLTYRIMDSIFDQLNEGLTSTQ